MCYISNDPTFVGTTTVSYSSPSSPHKYCPECGRPVQEPVVPKLPEPPTLPADPGPPPHWVPKYPWTPSPYPPCTGDMPSPYPNTWIWC